MKLSDEDYDLIYKKLEYRFKNSGNELVNKIKSKGELSKDDIKLILKKLEYTFRKSNNDIITKLAKNADLDNYSTVSYSNIKAKNRRDIKNKEKDIKNLKHLENFNNF